MVTPSADTAQSWRDLAEQLTPEQIADVTAVADESYRLPYALRLCQLNKARNTLADMELPPDASGEVSEWDEWDCDGTYYRSYTAWAHPTVDVYVFGTQDSHGNVTRSIACTPDELAADQARDLAAALHQAAYELERWQ